MSELKCCPFCGGEAEIAYSNDNHKQPYIRCKFGVMENPKCPASNMYQWQFHSIDEAIKAWNTRTPMANIVEKLEQLPYKTNYSDYVEKGMVIKYLARNSVLNIVKQEIGVMNNEPTNN